MRIIIVGAGEVGFHIASHLSRENKDVVVIDNDPEAARRVSERIDVQAIHGSGSNPLLLEEAGVKNAEIILAVTNHDETNLVASLMASIVAPHIKKIARVRGAGFDKYHDSFRDLPPHIDHIISPEIEVVKTIENLMGVPGAVDVNEFADGRVKFVGIHMENDELTGIPLSKLSKVNEDKPLIAAVVRNGELIIPRGNDTLEKEDLVYFISEAGDLQKTLAFFKKQEEPINRALIVGGGRIGGRLAASLEKKSIQTKLIDKDAEQCEKLADSLDKTVVLHGDASDQTLLNEVNAGNMDIVITLTGQEETNILTSLLAKRMGVRKIITKINKFSYFPLMSAIGLEQVISPRLSAINSILGHIRRGKVISAVSIIGDQAEVMEAVALETSDIVGKPLNKLSIPKGALIAGIIRGDDVTIPDGRNTVEPGDKIIIFARRQAIPKIEDFLSVKLEYF
ncbi:Trk system potassium transport protein TrkA [Candidatus Desulfarcum epimagneticum]|uniref:Trk system potassium uptake protein TrkA n=1 Tax=uncultured Desulfobacteraceae bacterium TaxID=218296 RepID=A0A484HQV1_9BACT|nr:Trk system potassium transport protein TrkA [uncultured Desulfobacteraceae bacterium]